MSQITLEIPDPLRKSIEELAARDGASIQQFILRAAHEKIAAAQSVERLRQEAALGRREDFDKFLAAVPQRSSDPGRRTSLNNSWR